MELQNKILDAFQGKVVRKDLAFLVKGNLPVPTFVLEYLLGQYCACDDEELIAQGLEKVKSVIQNNYVHRAEAEEVKGKIREAGKYRIIDKISVQLNDRADQYEAFFANLGLNRIPIGSEYVRRNPKLLSGNGVWSIININYLSGEDVKIRWEIENLKPIQISNITLQEYIDQRKNFNTEEWIDLLVHTVGLDPEKLNRREKFITLARLLPLVENNFNFMELGPKGTGKSHVFSELSPYGVLVSGGDVTSARLFSKISGNNEILGLVGYWDVVAWDEYEQQKGKTVDAVLVDTMQNYLANKTFNRGKATHEASASMAFVGNTKHTVPYMLKNSHLFESIPNGFIKGAFLDRIHLYNPGWEISTLKKDSFSKGYGLITDYIAAVLHELRVSDHSALLNNFVKFDTSLSERDHAAIRKTFSGMIKLLYPDLNFTKEEAMEIIDFAGECRKRVKDQLYIIDETFREDKPAVFQYLRADNGKTVVVETLERIENGMAQPEQLPQEVEPEALPNAAGSTSKSTETRVRLASKIVNIRANQKGVSYKSLFGDYLRTAKTIKVVDPWVRLPHQIDNFVELVQVIREVSDYPEEVKIRLSTHNDEERIPEMIDILDDLKDELATFGIEFEYDFDAVHDRQIELDNGWTIIMGRGLDIFEKFNRFSIGATRQACRRCRESSFTFIENV
ncbi:MAG: BREX system Lon protease-like protein BrxL [Bacteroidaceae bacterium]|nr:BREX system Lon protease-like protein BrxL [Bacteroidaceae bacterium]